MSDPAATTASLAGQEARILLTAVCNYRCIFCHNEGVDRSASAFRPDAHTLFSLIQDIVRLGGRDLTLTGGEPLLHKDLALEATGHVARICPGARMTIVTNGSLPDQNWIEKAAALGNLRINLSLHSCNPDIYRRITGQDRFSFEHIARRIAWLRRAGIPFKINCVALRDYNTSRQSLADLCRFAADAGATALKIIELLVIDGNEHLFPYFIALDSVAERLPASFEFAAREPRRRVFRDRTTGLRVELQVCRRRNGCNRCLVERTACFNSAGRYWPCFEYSKDHFDLREMSLDQALQNGWRVLRRLARRFGDRSPSLIRDAVYTERKREAYFICNDRQALKHLSSKARKTAAFEWVDHVFDAEHGAVPEGQVVTVRVHAGNPENARLIIKTVYALPVDGLWVTETLFLDKDNVPMEGNIDLIRNTLRRLGWREVFAVHMKGAEYEYEDRGRRCEFSVAEINSDLLCLALRLDPDATSPPPCADLLVGASSMTSVQRPFPEFLRARYVYGE